MNQNQISQNQATFEQTLAKHYDILFSNDPEYSYAKARTTPQALAGKMTYGLRVGSANKDGEGIKRTCKELGIKHTYKAIQEYLK